MNKPTFFACWVAVFVLAPWIHAAEFRPTPISPEMARDDIKLLRGALETIHPGYSRYTSRESLDLLFDSLERRVQQGTTELGLYRDISYLLAKIRCGHTKAEISESIKEFRMTTPSFLPFTLRVFPGRAYVDQVDNSQTGPQRGDEVLFINGHAVGDVLERVEKYLSVDGWTDHAKRVEFEFSSELLGNAIDHFWPMLYGWPDKWTFVVRDVDSNVNSLELKPVTYSSWLDIATDGQGDNDFGPETVRFRILNAETAYLAIDTFVNYRDPVDAGQLFQPFFTTMRQAGVKHLVLDLRKCGGGSDDVPNALLEFLAAEPIEIVRRPSWVRTYRFDGFREHLKTWEEGVWNLPDGMFRKLENGFFEFRPPDFQASMKITPAQAHFGGQVTLLSSPANSSGATNLIALLRDKRKNVKVVGESTGGTAEGTTAGLIFFLKLPNCGTTIRIPALRNFNPVSTFEPGLGVQPDLHVQSSLEDFLNGTDTTLELAVKKGAG